MRWALNNICDIGFVSSLSQEAPSHAQIAICLFMVLLRYMKLPLLFFIVTAAGLIAWGIFTYDGAAYVQAALFGLLFFTTLFVSTWQLRRQNAMIRELRRQKQENAALLDLIPAQIFYKDTHNRYLRVNRNVEETAGLKACEIEGRLASEVFPGYGELFFQQDLAVITTGEPLYGIIEAVPNASGKHRLGRSDKIPLKDAAGKVTGILNLVYDITDSKAQEEKIDRQTKLLLMLQDISLSIVYRLELDELLRVILASLCTLLDAPHGYVAFPTDASGRMRIQGLNAMFHTTEEYWINGQGDQVRQLWESGKIQVIDDLRSWPSHIVDDRLTDLTTVVVVPLRSADSVISIVGVAFERVIRPITAEERSALRQFAAVASVALHNAEIYSNLQTELTERKVADTKLQRHNKLLSFLHTTSLEIMNRQDVVDLLETIVQKAAEITGASTGSVLLFNEDRTERIRVVATGPAEKMLGSRNRIDEGAAGMVWKTKRLVLINDYKNWEHRSYPAEAMAEAVVYFPLKSASEVTGIIGLWHTEPGCRFEPEDVEILEQLANLASIAYENAYLYREAQRELSDRRQTEKLLQYQSFHDSLTGLYNRTYFEEEMQRLDKRRKGSVGLIMLDVDGLKLINDTLGHEKGDVLLTSAAHILSLCFRESDVVARIGGDEFAALLAPADEESLEIACKRIRAKTDEFNRRQLQAHISLSIGYAFADSPAVPMRELFKRADNNMYREKLHQRQSTRSAIVQTVMRMLEARDYITEGHAERLQEIVAAMGHLLGFTPDKISDLRLFAQFHDIGKVGIPDRILLKPGQLTLEEITEMQRHSEIGHRIAQSAPDLIPIADWVLKHHEWWNGRGYPLELAGEEIPLECRILSIADAYDAMTSDRPYRQALSHADAVQELKVCAGTQFDPAIVELFISLYGESAQKRSILVGSASG